MSLKTLSMAVVLFCMVLLGTYGIGESFLVSGGSCYHDNDCGLGLCDRDNHCRCYGGWTGLRCSKSDTHANLAGLCDHFLCNHGRCHQGSKCVCDSGWHGYVCDIPDHGHFETLPEATTASHSSGTPCGHHHCYQGYCENAYHSRCQCDRGWAGMECTHNIAHCGGSQCYHGDCHFSNCECHPGWTGSECETALHVYECNGQPCHNGDCEWAPYRQQICKCFDGWTGQDCARKGAVAWQRCGYDWCLRGECKIPMYHRNYQCICHRGWTGNRCTEPATLSHCNGINCYHGVCHSDVHNSESYCVCDVGWTQRDCNTHSDSESVLIESKYTGIATREEVSTFTQPPTVQTQAPTSAPTTTPTSTPVRTSSTTTHSPSTTLSTTNLPATPSTTTTQGTTVSPLHAALCMKFATVSDISTAKVSSNQNAISCASGNKTSPEAFVLEHCNVTAPSTWKEGVNIMANCDSLPLYTPVASFSSHRYSSAGTLCGVLVGCLQDGFQMAVQYCDQPPMIEHVVTNNGSFALDAATYYTIMI